MDLNEDKLENAASALVQGKTANAIATLAGVLTTAATGHPVLGGLVAGGAERGLAAMFARSATVRLEKAWAEERCVAEVKATWEKAIEAVRLGSVLAFEETLRPAIDDLSAQSQEQFLQLTRVLSRGIDGMEAARAQRDKEIREHLVDLAMRVEALAKDHSLESEATTAPCAPAEDFWELRIDETGAWMGGIGEARRLAVEVSAGKKVRIRLVPLLLQHSRARLLLLEGQSSLTEYEAEELRWCRRQVPFLEDRSTEFELGARLLQLSPRKRPQSRPLLFGLDQDDIVHVFGELLVAARLAPQRKDCLHRAFLVFPPQSSWCATEVDLTSGDAETIEERWRDERRRRGLTYRDQDVPTWGMAVSTLGRLFHAHMVLLVARRILQDAKCTAAALLAASNDALLRDVEALGFDVGEDPIESDHWKLLLECKSLKDAQRDNYSIPSPR